MKEFPETITTRVNLKNLRTCYCYQRRLKDKWVDEISKQFNTNLCGPVFLSKRKDGEFYLIDGQQRVAAAKKTKKDLSLCGKIVDLSDSGLTDSEVIAYEARMFISHNRDHKNLLGLELLKAEHTSGCPVAKEIITTVEMFGFSMSPNGGKETFAKAGAIETLKRACKSKCLNQLLVVLSEAKKNNSTLFFEFLNKEKNIRPLLDLIMRNNLTEEDCEKLGDILTDSGNGKILQKLEALTTVLNLQDSNKKYWIKVVQAIEVEYPELKTPALSQNALKERMEKMVMNKVLGLNSLK